MTSENASWRQLHDRADERPATPHNEPRASSGGQGTTRGPAAARGSSSLDWLADHLELPTLCVAAAITVVSITNWAPPGWQPTLLPGILGAVIALLEGVQDVLSSSLGNAPGGSEGTPIPMPWSLMGSPDPGSSANEPSPDAGSHLAEESDTQTVAALAGRREELAELIEELKVTRPSLILPTVMLLLATLLLVASFVVLLAPLVQPGFLGTLSTLASFLVVFFAFGTFFAFRSFSAEAERRRSLNRLIRRGTYLLRESDHCLTAAEREEAATNAQSRRVAEAEPVEGTTRATTRGGHTGVV